IMMQERLFNEELARYNNSKGTNNGNQRHGGNASMQYEMKFELAAMHVYDKALTWHQQFVKKYRETSPWDLYEREALKRSGLVFEDPMV
ncbi:hypothetical protein Tco_0238757, partial [Tanacetum coccineum]